MGTHSRNLHIMRSLHARNVAYLSIGSFLRFFPAFSFFILSRFERISNQSIPRQEQRRITTRNIARWAAPTVIISGDRNRSVIAWKDSNIVALKRQISETLNPEFRAARRKVGDMTGS